MSTPSLRVAISVLMIFSFNYLFNSSFASVARPKIPLSKTVLDFEPLHIKKLQEVVDDTKESTLHVKFTAFDKDFDVKLYHRSSFSKDIVVATLETNGTESKRIPQRSRAYRTQDHTVALTLDGHRDGIVRGIIERFSEVFHIMTTGDVHGLMQVHDKAKQILYASGTQLIIFRDGDIIEDPDSPQYCGAVKENATLKGDRDPHDLDFNFRSTVNRARRGAPSIYPPPKPCTSKPINLNIGFAADTTFLKRVKDAGLTFQTWLDTNVNIISSLYFKTFHTTITVTYVIESPEHNAPSWDPCYVKVYTKLDSFTYWRGASKIGKSRPEGLFHLMSACYTTGIVGMAYRDQLCKTGIPLGGTSGTAVSSGKGLGWNTVAHEIAHNFGAYHDEDKDPKSIMYPTSNDASTFSRKTQNSGCESISRSLRQGSTCFTGVSPCINQCKSSCGEFGCCGQDGCGDSCGTCQGLGRCYDGVCKCTRQCDGRTCGADGCGGQCGTCGDDQFCLSSNCVNNTKTDHLFLEHLNKAREKYHLKPLEWSSTLEKHSKEITNLQCKYSFYEYKDEYGYNTGTWRFMNYNPSDAHKIEAFVKNWVDQGDKWTCSNDTCQLGGRCREYTQIVHEKVTRVGCTFELCQRNNANYVLCAYDYNGQLASSTPFNPLKCETAVYKTCQARDSCESTNKECGHHHDGCKIQECGECGDGALCQNYKCICVPTSCSAQGKTCGKINDGCGGTLFCGSCDEGRQCLDNRCSICTPLTTCITQNRTCGYLYDGCELISCGACIEGSDCQSGKCVPCSGCHSMATCEDTTCKCMLGFIGDGYNKCTAVSDLLIDSIESDGPGDVFSVHNSWKIEKHHSHWTFVDRYLKHSALKDNAIDIALLDENVQCNKHIVTSFSVMMTKKKHSNKLGVVFKIRIDSYLLLFYDATIGTFNIGYVQRDLLQSSEFLANTVWNDDISKKISVDIVGEKGITIYFESKKYSYANNDEVDLCRLGVFSQGEATFFDTEISTKSIISISLVEWIPEKDIVEKITNTLCILSVQIPEVVARYEIQNRRDVVETVTPTTYSLTLSGSASASSAALASSLTSAIAQQSSSLAATGMVAISSSLVVPTVAVGLPALYLGATGTAGISTVAIAGMVGCGVALVGISTAGGIYYMKKSRNSSSSSLASTESNKLEVSSKEIFTFGVNVMNPDVHLSRTFSLTQRNFIGYPTTEPIM